MYIPRNVYCLQTFKIKGKEFFSKFSVHVTLRYFNRGIIFRFFFSLRKSKRGQLNKNTLTANAAANVQLVKTC